MRPNRLLKIGSLLLALGSGPLLLYALFGPRDGNPIGLGLLFFFSFPAALVCLALGGAQALRMRGRAHPAADPFPGSKKPEPQARNPGRGPGRGPRHPDDWG